MIGRIYLIKYKINKNLYIGSTTRDVYKRLEEHKRDIIKYPYLKKSRKLIRNFYDKHF